MTRNLTYLLVSCILFLNCQTSKNTSGKDSLDAKELMPYGRTSYAEDGSLELISSAVHFGFSFVGRECSVMATIPLWLDHNYLQYELDGVYQRRLRVGKDSSVPITISSATEGKHVVWIFKATEAATGAIYIKKIIGKEIKALPNSNAPLIEFIGNSITCGAAADASEIACGAGPYYDQHNAYYAYGPRAARSLGVNYILNSVSGIGIYKPNPM